MIEKYHTLKLATTKIAIVLALLAGSSSVSAQFDGQFSQYMNNLSLVNPADVGNRDMIQVSIFQRTQWIGMPGAPIVSMLSADMPFKLFGRNHGAGLQFLSDIFGVFNNQQIKLMYAYKQPLGKGYFSFATNIGILNVICNGDSINIARISSDDGYHTQNDPKIPLGKQTGVGFDLGLGVQYTEPDRYDVGLSLTHLTSPEITLGDKASFKVNPLLQLHGGYKFRFTNNPNLKLRTNAFIMSDFVSWTASIAANFDIRDKFWIGGGYRFQDALSIMAGMRVFEGFKLGYTCDLPTSKLITKTFWSHEIFASYEFSLVRDKSKASKSIRIL